MARGTGPRAGAPVRRKHLVPCSIDVPGTVGIWSHRPSPAHRDSGGGASPAHLVDLVPAVLILAAHGRVLVEQQLTAAGVAPDDSRVIQRRQAVTVLVIRRRSQLQEGLKKNTKRWATWCQACTRTYTTGRPRGLLYTWRSGTASFRPAGPGESSTGKATFAGKRCIILHVKVQCKPSRVHPEGGETSKPRLQHGFPREPAGERRCQEVEKSITLQRSTTLGATATALGPLPSSPGPWQKAGLGHAPCCAVLHGHRDRAGRAHWNWVGGGRWGAGACPSICFQCRGSRGRDEPRGPWREVGFSCKYIPLAETEGR